MHNGSPYGTQADPYELGDGADPWGDAAPRSASRRSSRHAIKASTSSRDEFDGPENDAASTATLGRAGLRSRKASVHRRAASLASASHPLQSPSSPNRETNSNAERPRYSYRRRQASENDLLDGSGTLFDDESERETVREPDIMVIVHEVRFHAFKRPKLELNTFLGLGLRLYRWCCSQVRYRLG